MSIQAITVNRISFGFGKQEYYRVSLYEFKGSGIEGDSSPMVAVFKEDLGIGSWDAVMAVWKAKELAKQRKIQFIQNLQMGDSSDKLFKQIFR